MKLEQLKKLVRDWKKQKSLTTAYDICEFLANNLNLEDEYKVEIWQYHEIVATFKTNDVDEAINWFRKNWKLAYDSGDCYAELYKGGKSVGFDEAYELGFYKDEEDEK